MIMDILSDENMKKEIINDIESGEIILPSNLDIADTVSEIEKITEYNIESNINAMSIIVDLESIIEIHGRPALIVKNNTFEVPKSKIWKEILSKNKRSIDSAIPSVGRIELRDHPLYTDSYYGTGWLIAEDIIVTNRHVASFFINHSSEGKWQFRQTLTYGTVKARIDFLEEHQSYDEDEFDIVDILHVAPDIGNGFPDIAFFRIDSKNLTNKRVPIPLLDDILKVDSAIAVIGYPANDRKRIWSDGGETGVLAMDHYFNGNYDVKRIQPGYVLNSKRELLTYDSTTLNKNSGSVILDITTGKAAGLHVAGKYGKHNLAIPSQILIEELEKIS